MGLPSRKCLAAQGKEGSPVGLRMEGMEKQRKQTVAEAGSHFLLSFAGDFSFVSGCKLKCLQRPGYNF